METSCALTEFVIYASRCCPSRRQTFIVLAENEAEARSKAYDVLYPRKRVRGFWKEWTIAGVHKR